MGNIVGRHLDLQSIEFQEGSMLFKELILSVKELQEVKEKKDILNSDAVPRLSKIIAHHTGLNIVISIGSHEPCVEIPKINKNNILINSFIKNFFDSSDGLRMIANADGVARGTVNLKTSKVTGIFSEFATTMHLPLHMFTNTKFTPEEISAIMLHECGHIFTFCEFMNRIVTTNQALAGMSKALDNSNSVAEREMVFITIKKKMNLTDLDEKELAKSTNNKTSEIVVLSNIVNKTTSELGSNVYDFSSWEYLCDQFAARHGAGRHLVTGLEKIFKGHWNISFRSLPAYLAMEAFKIVMIISAFTIPQFGQIAINLAYLLIAIDGSGDGTYDTPGARFKRVRNQIVENLKDHDLSNEDVDRLNEDLKAIDNVLKEVHDRRQLFGIIWDAVNVFKYKQLNQKKLQQELEELAANELFVKAAEFKQFA